MPITFEHLGGSRKGQVEQLAGARIGVGRDPANALPFDPVADSDVSTNHAEIRLEADGLYYVTDLGSRNGTFVNGARVTARTMLPPGATVKFGESGPEVKCTYAPVYAPAPGAGPGAPAPAPARSAAPAAPASKASADNPMLIVGIVAGAVLLLVIVVVLIVVLSGGEEAPPETDAAPAPRPRAAAPSAAATASDGAIASAAPVSALGGDDDAVVATPPAHELHPTPAAAAAKPPPKPPTRPEPPPAPTTDFYGDPLPEGAVARAGTIHTLAGRGQPFALLADDRSIAVACGDGKVRVFDLETGRRTHEFEGTGPLAASPDGRTLALVEVRSVTLRSLETGEAIRTLKTYPRRLAFAPGGRALAVWGGSEEMDYVRLFDVATGKEIRAWGKEPPPPPPPAPRPPPGSDAAPAAAPFPKGGFARPAGPVDRRDDWYGHELGWFSSDGASVAILGNDDKGAIDVSLFEVGSGKQIRRTSIPAWNRRDRTIAPDPTVGGFVPFQGASGAGKGAFVEVYDLKTLTKLRSIKHPEQFNLIQPALSPDAKRLVAGLDFDGSVFCYDVASGKEVWHLGAQWPAGHNHRHGHLELVYAPDGKSFAATTNDALIKLHDAGTGREIRRIESFPLYGREGTSLRLTFSPGGGLIAGATDESLHIWSAATGAERFALDASRSEVLAVAFSPDGKILASGSADQALRTFDAHTGRPLASTQTRGAYVTGIAFPPDGTSTVSATNARSSFDKEAFVQSWDAASLKERRKVRLEGCSGGSDLRIALSPEGGFAAFNGSKDVHVVDVATGKAVRSLEGLAPRRIALSPRGERVALAGFKPSLGVWDVKSGKRLFAVNNEDFPFFTVDVSADGRFITAPKGGDLLVWDLVQGKKRQSVRPEDAADREEVRTLALSADGALLAAFLYEHERAIRVWDVASGKRIASFPGHAALDPGRRRIEIVWSLAFSPDGTHLASCATDGTALIWRVPAAR